MSINEGHEAVKKFDKIKDERVYEEPEPFVPYPHVDKKVTPYGFVRDRPDRVSYVLESYQKWHDLRKDLSCNSKGGLLGSRQGSLKNESEFGLSESPQRPVRRKIKPIHFNECETAAVLPLRDSITLLNKEKKITSGDLGATNVHRSPTMLHKQKRSFLIERIDSSTRDDWFNKIEGTHVYHHDITNFRLQHQAANYDFAYRPFEEKMIKQKKKKDLIEKQRNGYVGSPEKSNERFINKLFDFRRKKASEIGNNEGCS